MGPRNPAEVRLLQPWRHEKAAALSTVAELEAQLKARQAEDPQLIEINNELERLGNIKKQVIYQCHDETDSVVSTLRGWLRETK